MNIKVQPATAGIFTGTKLVTYTINKANFDDIGAKIDAIANQTYKGEAIEPAVKITATGNYKFASTDFVASYSNNTNVGTATVTVTASADGNYTGTLSDTFEIVQKSWGSPTISEIADQLYTGGDVKPDDFTVTLANKTVLTKDEDYELTYKNNKKIGTATVVISPIGNYTGNNITRTFKIVAGDISKAEVAAIPDMIATGEALKPALTIKNGDYTLVEGTDYSAEYSDNVEVGTAKVAITGLGGYAGTETEATFEIKNDFSKATIAAIAAKTYTGKALTPAVTVKIGTTTLKANTDYTVAYKNNTNAGKATVTVTPAGSYSGAAKTATFKINKANVKAKITKITGKNAVGAGKAVTLKATLSPAKSNANQNVNTTVKWASNKTAVAKVDAKTGKVTGVSAGTAKITATSAAGNKKTYNVKVYGIASKNLKQTVNAGKSKNVAANDTVNKATSSNTKVATATVKGKKVVIKGVKKGTAKITVTTKNDGGKNVITVTVK